MFIGYLLAALCPVFAQTSDELVLQAKQAIAGNDLERATALLSQVVSIDPEPGEAHFLLAQIYARRGEDESTIEHYLRALELLPGVARIWEFYGNWLLQEGYYDEAERVFEHLVGVSPDSASYCAQRGRAVYSGGNPSQARQVLVACLELPGAGSQTLYLLALASRMLGDSAGAHGYIDRGLALEPGHVELTFQKADLLLQQGKLEESLRYWEKLPADHLGGLYGQAVTRLQLGHLEAARRGLEEVLARQPEHARAHYQLALLFQKSGDPARAEPLFRRFRELEELDRRRRQTQTKKEIVRKNEE